MENKKVFKDEIEAVLSSLFVTIRAERRTLEYSEYVSPLFDKVVQDAIQEESQNGYNFVAHEVSHGDVMLVFQRVDYINRYLVENKE